MSPLSRTVLSTIVLGATLCAADGARADAIDGHWCHADGRRMSISGPRIVTPGGSQITGDYDRHGFVYVVPAGESGAGQQVQMTLRSEYIVHVRQGGAEAPVQVWNRCAATVS